MQHELMAHEFEGFVQKQGPLHHDELYPQGLHRLLDSHISQSAPPDLSYLGYQLTWDSTRPGMHWLCLILVLKIEGQKSKIPATSFPTFTTGGILLYPKDQGGFHQRRPIWQLILNLPEELLPADRKEHAEKLKNQIKKHGLHPQWCKIISLVDRLRFSLRRALKRWGDNVPDDPWNAACLLAGTLDHSFYHIFLNSLDLIPLAETTNQLAGLAQSRQVKATSLHCHRRTLTGQKPKDPVRNLRPEHIGMFCPVETPESENIGLVLHLARQADPGNWSGSEELFSAPGQIDSNNFLGLSASLVPFIQHNDPTRAMMGAKNMKQALPLASAEPPLIQTGFEAEVFEQGQMDLGRNLLVAYLPWYGLNYEDGIVISESAAQKLHTSTTHHLGPFICPGSHTPANPDQTWPKLDYRGQVPEGLHLYPGDVLAAWYPVSWKQIKKGEGKGRYVKVSTQDPIAEQVPAYVQGRVVEARYEYLDSPELPLPQDWPRLRLSLTLDEERPLQVGDKIMGRHGNKGVVSAIVPDKDLPYFLDPVHGHTDLPSSPHYHHEDRPHSHVQVILNPLGVIGRMNIGQLVETHTAFVSQYLPHSYPTYQYAGQPFQGLDFRQLVQDLEDTQVLDQNGKTRLMWQDKQQKLITAEHKSVVGIQYLMKLDHMAQDKYHCCGHKVRRSLLTKQPVKGRSQNGGLRLGEMETWCLLERQTWQVISELLGKSEPDSRISSNQALEDILYALGLKLEYTDQDYTLAAHGNRFEYPEITKPVYKNLNKKTKSELKNTSYDQEIFGNESCKFLDKPQRDSLPLSGWGAIPLPFPVLHPLASAQDEPIYLSRIPVLPCRYRPLVPQDGHYLTTTLDIIYDLILELTKRISHSKKDPRAQVNQLRDKDPELGSLIDQYLSCRLHHSSAQLRIKQIGTSRSKIQNQMQKICAAQKEKLDQKVQKGTIKPQLWQSIQEYLLDKPEFRHLQQLSCMVQILYQFLLDLLQGKDGLLRGYILGKRFPFSGRAVIVPDPSLPLGEVGIPRQMFDVLFPEPQEDAWLLLNRPPSLLPSNIQAFIARPEADSWVIRINPGLCAGFGADFDGDQMSAFALHSFQAIEEAKELLRPGSMPLNPKNAQPNLSLNLEIKLGQYLLYNRLDQVQNLLAAYLDCRCSQMPSLTAEKTVEGKEVNNHSPSLASFEPAEPDPQHQSTTVNPVSSQLSQDRLQDIAEGKGLDQILQALSKEKRESFAAAYLRLCFEAATDSGLSFGVFDLQAEHRQTPPDLEHTRINMHEDNKDSVQAINDNVKKWVNETLRTKDNASSLAVLTKSGAASKVEQTGQLIHSRGAIPLPYAPTQAAHIQRSYTTGLKEIDFFYAACATRQAMMFKKLRTAYGGYFTRKLIEAGYARETPKTEVDPVFVPPFTALETVPDGLLAAHLLGEEGTQAAMKVFHTGQTGAVDAISAALDTLNKKPAPDPEQVSTRWAEMLSRLGINKENPKAKFWFILLQILAQSGLTLNDYGPEQANLLSALSFGHVQQNLIRAMTQAEPISPNLKERFILHPKLQGENLCPKPEVASTPRSA